MRSVNEDKLMNRISQIRAKKTIKYFSKGHLIIYFDSFTSRCLKLSKDLSQMLRSIRLLTPSIQIRIKLSFAFLIIILLFFFFLSFSELLLLLDLFSFSRFNVIIIFNHLRAFYLIQLDYFSYHLF